MQKKKTKTDKNQLELNLNLKKETQRKYPTVILEARLNRIKEARAQRLIAEEKARHYHAIVKDLKKKYGSPTKKNLRQYLKQMSQEKQTYEAISRSYARTGSDKELVEIHSANAEMVDLYIQQIREKFSRKRR